MSRKIYNSEEIKKIKEKFGLFFKINIPVNIDGYLYGNGEGCWAICFSEEDDLIYDSKGNRSQFKAILLNDSIYFPELVYGIEILLETRGENRPVACWDNLSNTDKSNQNRIDCLDKLDKLL